MNLLTKNIILTGDDQSTFLIRQKLKKNIKSKIYRKFGTLKKYDKYSQNIIKY